MTTVAVINQKGGVGKTTTCINLGAELGKRGFKTLLVDLDPQCNTTSGIGFEEDNPITLYDVLTDSKQTEEALYKLDYKNLWLIPADINLAGVERENILNELESHATTSKKSSLKKIMDALSGKQGNSLSKLEFQKKLKTALDSLPDKFDIILIDCPPALGYLTVNAMAAADRLLVPLQCQFFALQGFVTLTDTVQLIRENLNPHIEIDSILLTMFDPGTNMSKEVREQVKEAYGAKLLNTVIPRNISLSEAQSYGQPICYYDAKSKGAQAYSDLAKEVKKKWQL